MSPQKKSRNNPLVFNIARLWGAAEGSSEKHSIEAKPDFADPDIRLASDMVGELLFIKLKKAISVVSRDMTVKLRFTCSRCLKEYVAEVSLVDSEREFHSEIHKDDRIYDVFYIDLKAMEIDLGEMLRQEIILHFPLISLCSERCKGLCQVCGKDRNKVICRCKVEEPETGNRQLQQLKKMFDPGKVKAVKKRKIKAKQ